MADYSSKYGAQLQKLKQQMEELGSGLAPAFAKVAHEAETPVRKLLGYVELATKFAPQVIDIVGNLTSRGGEAAATAVRPAAASVARPLARANRHRILTASLVVASGLVTYGVVSGKLPALVRRYRRRN